MAGGKRMSTEQGVESWPWRRGEEPRERNRRTKQERYETQYAA